MLWNSFFPLEGIRPVHSEKIGYADVDYIFNKLPAAKQIEAELKSLQVQLEAQLKNKYEEFRKKYEVVCYSSKDCHCNYI